MVKKSFLVDLIIKDIHQKMSHSGVYAVMLELRKFYWILSIFCSIRKIVKNCTVCKSTIKLNQSSYRNERLYPENIPYRNVYLDYMGPFYVKKEGKQVKVYILIFTCMWSRAINLELCIDLSVEEFIRGFQLHCFNHGVPGACTSDLGSQLVAGANILRSLMNDAETQIYLELFGIKQFRSDHFFKGKSELGSLVESCVKLTKQLLYKSIGRNILSFRDFDFIMQKTIMLVNKRPVAFKNINCDLDQLDNFQPITPENLIRGCNLPMLNFVGGQSDDDQDPDWLPDSNYIQTAKLKFEKVRLRLVKLYNEYFLQNLISQAVNKKDRYIKVKHNSVNIGDIILIKDPLIKPVNYPMGIIRSLVKNDMGEVTGVEVFKGETKELIKRHINTIIPLLTLSGDSDIT